MTAEREVYAAILPSEPPFGTVVLDRFNRAWQRRLNFGNKFSWYGADVENSLRWFDLLSIGQVTEIYRPEPQSAESAQ